MGKPIRVPPAYELNGFPLFSNLTLLQAAFIDNGPVQRTPSGRRSNAVRYKLTLEAYESPPPVDKRLYAFKRSLELRDQNAFATLITKQLGDGLISQPYHDELATFISTASSNMLFGQVRVNNGGWTYIERQYAGVELDPGQPPIAVVITSCGMIALDQFSDHFASGVVKYTTQKSPPF